MDEALTESQAAAVMGRKGGKSRSERKMAQVRAMQRLGAKARRGRFGKGHVHRSRKLGVDVCACGALRVARGVWRTVGIIEEGGR